MRIFKISAVTTALLASIASFSALAIDCTTDGSVYVNNGVTKTISITNGPKKGKTLQVVCVDKSDHWDLVSDFKFNSTYNLSRNPFGPWSVMIAPNGDTNIQNYNLVSTTMLGVDLSDSFAAQFTNTIMFWGKLAGNAAQMYFGVNKDNAVEMYADQSTSMTVVRWRSPYAGKFTISGNAAMKQGCGYGNDFFLKKGTSILQSTHLTTSPTQISQVVTLAKNESLYFIAQPTTAYYCQEVLMSVTIDGPAVKWKYDDRLSRSESKTEATMLAGLGVVGFMVRRRKQTV